VAESGWLQNAQVNESEIISRKYQDDEISPLMECLPKSNASNTSIDAWPAALNELKKSLLN
jgi:hypothetical protein